jgi:hypothetical protein
MRTPQGCYHHRQHVVGDQGQTKTEPGRLGIPSCLNFRMDVGFEMLERGLQRPARAIEPCHPFGREACVYGLEEPGMLRRGIHQDHEIIRAPGICEVSIGTTDVLSRPGVCQGCGMLSSGAGNLRTGHTATLDTANTWHICGMWADVSFPCERTSDSPDHYARQCVESPEHEVASKDNCLPAVLGEVGNRCTLAWGDSVR